MAALSVVAMAGKMVAMLADGWVAQLVVTSVVEMVGVMAAKKVVWSVDSKADQWELKWERACECEDCCSLQYRYWMMYRWIENVAY